MSQQRGDSSFLHELRSTIETLGGQHTTSTYGQALQSIADEIEADAAPVSIGDALTALGGRHTTSVLGQALLALADEGKPRKGNLTSQWLAANGRKTHQMLIEHLANRLQTSRQISVIEDHVQTFLCRLVERDQLASFLEAGKPIQPSVLRVWAYQSACTEMRGWGVDASLRQSRGAKTHRDRQADAGKLPMVAIHSTECAVEHRYEVENGEVTSEIYSPNTMSAEEALISAETMARARALVLRKIAGAGPRYAALFDALVDGDKRTPLASEAGVSRNRMASMLSRIREVLRNDDTLAS